MGTNRRKEKGNVLQNYYGRKEQIEIRVRWMEMSKNVFGISGVYREMHKKPSTRTNREIDNRSGLGSSEEEDDVEDDRDDQSADDGGQNIRRI